MGEYYSMDLREQVSRFVEEGGSRRAATRQFAVGASCAIKLVKRRTRTGSVAPARQCRPRGSGKLEPVAAFLIATVEIGLDITMPELAERLLSEQGVAATPAMLSRFHL